MSKVRSAPEGYLYETLDSFGVHPDSKAEYNDSQEAQELKSIYPELVDWPNDAVCISWNDFIQNVHFGGCLDDSKRHEDFLAYLYAVIELSKVDFQPSMMSLDGLQEWWDKYDSEYA